jgi:very-short-patch-repair endonuclease
LVTDPNGRWQSAQQLASEAVDCAEARGTFVGRKNATETLTTKGSECMSTEADLYQEDDAGKLASELFGGKMPIKDALEKLRTRLLDLSMRNRLLNYRHPKGRSLEFAGNPDLDLLYERLEEGKSVGLAHVPDPAPSSYEGPKKPDVRSHAKLLGIDTSVDLEAPVDSGPYKRLRDLQAVLYPGDLERIARKVSSEARTVVEETGTNMLYLVFGFLEYFDSDASEKAVHAPLLAMPVNLIKGKIDPDSRTFLYDLNYSGEDIAENFTLREKLRQQFRLELPELSDEDTPESYFKKIQISVAKRRNWIVKRRLSLAFLSFGKLAIWADLDPANGEALLSSELLRNIFEGGRAHDSAAFHAEDYPIDGHGDGDLPLIYDADSSQHSALIDVKNGKSLVINGPPGTGKSQTITNIVASAIASGKKVLFVSEKLAALEVVKQRLESVGLGDFCLELHSHKTQKKQLLESIEERMTRRYSVPQGYDKRLDVIRERRKLLNTYAQKLGSREGNRLELTAHEVFWATELKRQQVAQFADSISGLAIPNAFEWNNEKFDRCRMTLSDVATAISELGCTPKNSPWIGFFPSLLIKGDEQQIVVVLEKAVEHARDVSAEAHELATVLSSAPWTMRQIEVAAGAAHVLEPQNTEINGELLESMYRDGIEDHALLESEFKRLCVLLDRIRKLQGEVRERLNHPYVEDGAAFRRALSKAKKALSTNAASATNEELGEFARRSLQAVEAIRPLISTPDTRVPVDAAVLLERLSLACADQATAHWAMHPAKEICALSEEAQREVSVAQSALNEVAIVLGASQVQFEGKVEEIHALLEGRGMQELISQADPGAALQEVRRLKSNGWEDWTAEKFSTITREIAEVVANAREASDELKSLLSRISLPIDLTKAGLEAIEVLLGVAESAPMELLGMRGAGFDRADFSEVAIQAEELFKRINHKGEKLGSAFHMDSLPDDESLRAHVRALRRGDSIFNLLRSDWRAARTAFKGSIKQHLKVNSASMAEIFSALLTWNVACAEFEANEQYRSTFGQAFQGLKTDFSKVRRLHAWVKNGSASLLGTEAGNYVQLTTVPEHHLMLLSAGAARIRGGMSKLRDLSKIVASLPGLDPALAKVRRADELVAPLEEYARTLHAGAITLKSIVRPTATVQRAVDLLELQARLSQHGELLHRLVGTPDRLAQAGARIGLPSSPVLYHDIGKAIALVRDRAAVSKKLSDHVSVALSDEYSPQRATEVLRKFSILTELMHHYLHEFSLEDGSEMHECLALIETRSRSVLELTDIVALHSKPGTSLEASVAGIEASIEAEALLGDLSEDENINVRFGPVVRGVGTDESSIRDSLTWASTLLSVSEKLPASVLNRLLRSDVARIRDRMVTSLQRANHSLTSYRQSMNALEKWGHIDWRLWGGYPFPSDAVNRLQCALESTSRLVAWSKFLVSRDEATGRGLADLLERTEEGQLPVESLVDAFEYVFLRTLSRHVLTTHRDLARFTGASHERLRAEYASLDKELIGLNGLMYAAKVDAAKKPLPGVSAGRAGDLTEMALLTKETKKQKRHVPIRQLLKRAGRSLQELKPCFMMGPLSVAQYLEQGHLKFDLVVMDEASQLRPEDALGALARGRQLVVVGDPKQLPPTNFFDRLVDGDDEEADDTPAVVDGVESILGICEHLYRPVRTLRWHYRSRHESLIAFSNSQFYDGRLVVFPSPYKRNKRLGLNYCYVQEGVYQDRRNIPEARRVVNAVINHMLNCPDESLGVVTLNQTQRELIEDLLDKSSRDVAGVAEYLERHKKDGWEFFVKNLENVQGDERDVIFVSTTFGKPADLSPVRQNFGPINRPNGWRRLNVLFTRARRRIDLFTSMQPDDVLVDEKASAGRRALRDYLEYAKTGVLPGLRSNAAEREPDSDFEIAVATALRAVGYESEPQIGVAGYFIDLGVQHPQRKGEYLAGIECDGVTYHSSLSARDRDRIRQDVLESLGWRGRIIRVWSTDWFADPDGQLQRLISFLQRRSADDALQPAPYDNDEPDITDAPAPPHAAEGKGETVTEVRLLDPSQALDEGIGSDLFVELGDRVTYETATEPIERHTVQIVDSSSNLKLGLLNDQTPLAQALIGLCEGDEAILRIKDVPTRTVKVLKIVR